MAKNENLIIWSRTGYEVLLGARCADCQGEGRFFTNSSDNVDCERCDGRGWFGVDPHMPVMAPCGSVEKIAMLTVRYAAGVPLWNPLDRPQPDLLPQPVDDFAEFVEDAGRASRERRRAAAVAGSNGKPGQSKRGSRELAGSLQ